MHIHVGSTVVGPSSRVYVRTIQCVYTFRYSHTLHLHWLPQWNIIYVVKRNRLEHRKHTSSSSPSSSSNNKLARKQNDKWKTTNIFSIIFCSLWIWFRNIHWLLTRESTVCFRSISYIASFQLCCLVFPCVCVRACQFPLWFFYSFPSLFFIHFTNNVSNRQLKHSTWLLLCFVFI